MTTSKLVIVLTAAMLIGDGEPGWLAQALARTDPDVDAAVAAYEAEDWPLALEHLDAATTRHGARPEIDYDRGLALLAQDDKEAAREAFQHGTESDVPAVLASSHYELGNLAMTEEDWETAITQYIACLRAQPDHQNAKWNLELALQRKREQEKKEQEEKEKNEDQEKGDEENKDEEKKDEEKKDEEKKDEEKEGEENKDQENKDEQKQDEQNKDQEKQDEQKQDPKPPEEPKEQEAQPKPIDSGDLDAALEQLDRQDEFMLGRPRASQRPVEKDW
jgi:Ca-activated chloride channel family protein